MKQVIRITGWLVIAASAGCPAPSEVPSSPDQVATVSLAPAKATPPNPASVSLVALPVPKTIAIDGELGEWGSLEAGPNVGLAPVLLPQIRPTGGGPDDAREPLPNAINPTAASSRVAVAVADNRVLVAAELGADGGETVWLGIGSIAPAVPGIGHAVRGGYTHPLDCEYEQIDGPEGAVDKGPPLAPEAAAACKALVARHTETTEKHRDRFVRRYRIDPSGVGLVLPDGSTSAIAGATVAVKPARAGKTLEASFPVKALPRMVDAPLEWLRVSARTVGGPMTPDIASDPWSWVLLPTPVSFDAMGPLRALAFEEVSGSAFFPPALSYQPGDALHVESIDYASSRSTIAPVEHVLYEKRASLGDVEVGMVHAYGEAIAIAKGGKFLHVLLPFGLQGTWGPVGNLAKIVERDGNLHVITVTPHQYTSGMGVVGPTWSVIAVHRDGSFNADLVEEDDGWYAMWIYEEVETFANADHSRLGARGAIRDFDNPEKPKGHEMNWQWDPAKKLYAFSEKSIPVPKKNVPKKR